MTKTKTKIKTAD